MASSPGLCTDAAPTATRACATLPADSPCDDGDDVTMADACATVELGSCAGVVSLAAKVGLPMDATNLVLPAAGATPAEVETRARSRWP